MKLRKILSSAAAGAVAVSAMAIPASAIDTSVYIKAGDDNNMIYVLADKEGDPSWIKDNPDVAIDSIYGVTYHLELDADAVAKAEWFGGKIGANSNSTSWKEFGTWGSDKETIKIDNTQTTADITYQSDKPIFAATDEYAQFWLQTYGAAITITSADLLAADGSVIEGSAGAAPVDEAATDEAAGDTTVSISYVEATTPAYTYIVPAGIDTLKVKVDIMPADGDAFSWNDWCGAGIVVDGEKFYQWGGSQVTWGWDADGDKNDDSLNGVKGDTWAGTVGADGGEISVPVSEGSVVDFYCLSWEDYANTQYTLTFEVPSASAPADDAAPAEDADSDVDAAADEADDTDEADDAAEDDDAAVELDPDADINDFLGTDDNNTVAVFGDGAGYIDVTGKDLLDIYGVIYNVTFDDDITDPAVWIGGGIGANSESTGWAQVEWGRAEKPIVPDFDAGRIIYVKDEPIFKDTDTFAQFWLIPWSANLTVDSVELITSENLEDVKAEEAEILEAAEERWAEEAAAAEEAAGDEADDDAAAADDTTADDAAADNTPAAGDTQAPTTSDKASPDTGVADVAVIAGLAIVAGGAVLVTKKRK